MKRVLLCPNEKRDKNFALTKKVAAMLDGCADELLICPMFEESRGGPYPDGLAFSTLEKELPTADMAVVFGGDGTILHAARAAAAFSVPILGVNMGSVGFMAQLEKEDIGMIPKAVGGKYEPDRRMLLDVELVRDGTIVYTDFALNDVVVAGVTKIIELTIYGDGEKISHFAGDGAVVATPTGSTAYSMSAGGPIVEPDTRNIIVTPICPHVLAAKAFVLASDRRVSIELGDSKANPAYLTVDGVNSIELKSGDVIRVSESKRAALLVRLSGRSFYNKVSEKLGERFEK